MTLLEKSGASAGAAIPKVAIVLAVVVIAAVVVALTRSRAGARLGRQALSQHPALKEAEGDPGVAGNERLTALAGAVLLVLIGVEVATIPNIRQLISLHIVVGIALVGPLAVKTASTGWRFLRYYTNHPAYRRKGPPRPVPRVLAPLLLITTVVVIGSGIALVTVSPGDEGVLHKVHLASFLLFAVLVGIHVLAYIRSMSELVVSDWGRHRVAEAPGRRYRLAGNLIALGAGAIAAILILPAFAAWIHW